ncbi:unnamed protein product [Diabrotica balteata]|uniref:CCHC-type domain-containing protein n=1 Tax=Diabrotica balteata TaxID=107213 RepID=A0A9N9T2S1_DIABA|nr:unnamed protein product [Diabrotica balteata]
MMLANCFQRHDESVSDFTTRLRILAARVLEEDLEGATIEGQLGIKKKNKELVLNQFKLGLRRDVMKETGVLLLKEPNLDLEKAEEIVALQEMNLMMTQGRANTARVSAIREEQRCHYCNKTGHLIRDCRTKKREQSSQEVKSKIDTGGAFSLIRKSLIQDKNINPEITQSLSLRGITGHEIDIYGTTYVDIQTTPKSRKTKARFIVCTDITLGEVSMLLGRDFLANHKAIISYKDEPSLILWGQSIPMLTAGEVMEVMTVKAYDNSHHTTRHEWNKWLSVVKDFLEKQHINDIKEDSKNLPIANIEDTARKSKPKKQGETQKKSQSPRVPTKQHTTPTKTSNRRNKTKRTEKTRIFTPTNKRTKQGRINVLKQDTRDRRKRLDTVENPLKKGETSQRNQEETVHQIIEDTQRENDQSKEEEKEPIQSTR